MTGFSEEFNARVGALLGGVDIVFKAAVGGGQVGPGLRSGIVPEDAGLPDFVAVEGAVVDHGEAVVFSSVDADSAVVVAEIAVAHLEGASDVYDTVLDTLGVADEAAVLDEGLGFVVGGPDSGS